MCITNILEGRDPDQVKRQSQLQLPDGCGDGLVIPISSAAPSLLDIASSGRGRGKCRGIGQGKSRGRGRGRGRGTFHVVAKPAPSVIALQDRPKAAARIRRRFIRKAPSPVEPTFVPEPLPASGSAPAEDCSSSSGDDDANSDSSSSSDDSSRSTSGPGSSSSSDGNAGGGHRKGVGKDEQVAHPEFIIGKFGKLVHDTKLEYIAAHCPYHRQCRVNRTFKRSTRRASLSQGRPIVFLMAWLYAGKLFTSKKAHKRLATMNSGITRQFLTGNAKRHAASPIRNVWSWSLLRLRGQRMSSKETSRRICQGSVQQKKTHIHTHMHTYMHTCSPYQIRRKRQRKS